MSVAELVVQKLQQLPEEQQRQVLAFIEQLPVETPPSHRTIRDPYGSCADLRSDLPLEEFQRNRGEMWGQATDKELE
jgi:hypothetical protein